MPAYRKFSDILAARKATEPEALAGLAGLAAADPQISPAGPGPALAGLAGLAGADPDTEISISLYKKIEEQKKNIYMYQEDTGGSTALAKTQKRPSAPAKPAKTAKVETPDDLDERADVPRAWADGYAALRAMPPPEGFWPDRWRHLVDDAGRFLDNWAGEAARCGWTTLDVFGCHPEAPAARFDCMGLVPLLGGVEVVAIDTDGADLVVRAIGSRQRFRRRNLPPGTVSLWELAR